MTHSLTNLLYFSGTIICFLKLGYVTLLMKSGPVKDTEDISILEKVLPILRQNFVTLSTLSFEQNPIIVTIALVEYFKHSLAKMICLHKSYQDGSLLTCVQHLI